MLFILTGCSQPAASTQADAAVQKDIPATLPSQSPTKEPTFTPIPEIRIETDPSAVPENLPVITLADFETGKVLEAEKKYLETHNPFNGNEIWPNSFPINDIWVDQLGKMMGIGNTTPPINETYWKNPNLFPARNLFIFKINLPKDFFPVPIFPNTKHTDYDYNKLNYLLLGQVWLNPDAKPDNPNERYRILHYLYILDEHYPPPADLTKTFILLPIYYLDIKKIEKDIKDQYYSSVTIVTQYTLYKRLFKNDIPAKYLDEWHKTNRIPKELENYILPGWGHRVKK